jgi:Zn-dependent protease with chaperone function
MIVAIIAPLVFALAVIMLAPQLLSRGAWRIARPRLALRAWLVAFVAGAVGFLVSLVAALGEILFAAGGTTGGPGDGWFAPVAVTLFGWVGLASLGGLAALAVSRYEPISAAERRANVQLVLAAAATTYRRERLRGIDVSFVDSARPGALATRGTGRQIIVSRGLEALLGPAELRSVLEHERAHLTEGHDRVVRLTRLNLACFPVLIGARSFERDVTLLIELAADDRAVQRCGVDVCAGALEAMARATSDESVALRALRLRQRLGRKLRSRSELDTTSTDEIAIAAAAMSGLRKPSAAMGIAATL